MPKKLFSMGRIVETIQESPAAVRKALAAARIEPVLELNNVPYYDEPALANLLQRRHHAGQLQPAMAHRHK